MTAAFDALTTPLVPGTTLIEASAGTGKTHAITRIVLRLILEGQVEDLQRILVVTYTNAATAELAGRLRDTLALAARACAGEAVEPEDLRALGARHGEAGAELLRRALLQVDELAVTTIHGFCKRVLETAAFESGMPFSSEFTSDEGPLVESAAHDTWRRLLYGDAELSVLATARGWSLDDLIKAHRIWRRHAGTRISPPAQPLATARHAVREAVAALMSCWDEPGVRRWLGTWTWKKHAPLRAETVDIHLAAVGSLAQELSVSGLDSAALFEANAFFLACDNRRHKQLPDHPVCVAATRLARALDALDHAWKAASLAELDARFDAAKNAERVLSFDDLLTRLRDALADPRRASALRQVVRARFSAALIDEFQDTDPVQYGIFRDLFQDPSAARPTVLVLVGDPKQAIYSFRGADLDTYLDAAAQADRQYQLEINWRSTAPMIAAVNTVFANAQRPFLADRIAFHPVRGAGRADRAALIDGAPTALHWWLAGDGTKRDAAYLLLARLAAEAVRLVSGDARIGDRPVLPRDLAVLVRTNQQAEQVQQALADAGIPAVVGGGGDVLASSESIELGRVLRGILDPGDAAGLRGALATTLWGWDAAMLHALNHDDRRWQALGESIEAWRARWQRDGIGGLIDVLLDEAGWAKRLLASVGGERRMTNLRHLRELLQAAEDEHHLAPAGLVAWLDDARAHDRLERERVELRLESDADAVRILTMHKAKGLEFPIVFCPFLWEARKPARGEPVSTRLDGTRVMGWPDAVEVMAQAGVDALGESLRLAYVALTRSVHRCYIAWAQTQDSPGSPLAYLLGQPESDGQGSDIDWSTAVRAHAKQIDLADRIRTLAERHCDLMRWERIDQEPVLKRPPPAAPISGSPRRLLLRPHQLDGWRTTSFTGLSAGADGSGRDHADPVGAPAPARPVGVHAFAAGARAGTCLHHWLERLDWQRSVAPAPITAALERFGLDDPAHHGGLDPVPAMQQLGEALRTTPMPGPGVPLASIPPGQRHAEWAFHLPLAALVPRELESLFASHGDARQRRDYAPCLAQLDGRTVQGFLSGFVDLVLVHDERWWVIDWKSNRLGDDGAAYHDDALWSAMVGHHYVLQQQLYLLALHRHLRARLPGYDPQRHLGGSVYVFLRGFAGGLPWHSTPADADLIEALDAQLIAPALAVTP